MATNTPYTDSTIVDKLSKRRAQNLPLSIVFSDLDLTMVSYPYAPTTNKAREMLEAKGYLVSFVTSKTEEIIISEKEKKASPAFSRPPAHMDLNDGGKHVYVPPEQVEPEGVLDPDIVAGSSGTAIYVKQLSGGYTKDSSYHSSIKQTPHQWRPIVLKAIQDTPGTFELNEFESEENYSKGVTNVYPPDYRVEVHFSKEEEKIAFINYFMKLSNEQNLHLQITDDSFPLLNKFSIYISPLSTSKHQAVNHIIGAICKELSVRPDVLDILIIGDSFPDLKMGLESATESKSTFLLVGGSPLYTYLIDDSKAFANEDIQEIKKNLVPSQKKGLYTYTNKGLHKMVILGDEAFPGTTGPETVIAYLKES